MGGDRTCPDDCLLAVWANLPAADRKTRRKPIAEKLYTQGFTMDQIATQLGVSHPTIVRDLREFVHDEQIKPAKTASNPKGAGRPKGKKTRTTHTAPTADVSQKMAEAVLDEGKTLAQVTHDFDLPSVQHAKLAIAKEQGRREAEPIITPDMLSMTAQQKFDAAIRQEKARLTAQFSQAVNEKVREKLDEMILPHWKKQIDEAQQLYARRRGLMDKATFNKIRRGLHPDSRNSISDKVLGEAFDTFMSLEKYLLDEKDSPTEVGAGLPRTWAEWEAAKQKARTARRSKRAGGRSAVSTR
jgi:hypothetical protein